MKTYSYYKKLKKPPFAPPSWVFGPVWTVLYILMFVTFGFIFYRFSKGELPSWIITVSVIHLASNFLYTPLQFGLKNNVAALIDVVIVDLTLAAVMAGIYQYYPWVTYALIPYLAWVCFATVLQSSVTYLNRRKR